MEKQELLDIIYKISNKFGDDLSTVLSIDSKTERSSTMVEMCKGLFNNQNGYKLGISKIIHRFVEDKKFGDVYGQSLIDYIYRYLEKNPIPSNSKFVVQGLYSKDSGEIHKTKSTLILRRKDHFKNINKEIEYILTNHGEKALMEFYLLCIAMCKYIIAKHMG